MRVWNEKESKLDDVWFIGGGDNYFEFQLKNENGEPIDVRTSEIKWTLSYMGQKSSPILVKDNKALGGITTSTNGVFVVTISHDDSMYLESTRYEHEATIIQPNGKVLRPSFGYVDIRQGSQY